MSKHLDELGGLPMFPPRSRNSDPDTSHEAAESMVGYAHAQQRRILIFLREHGPQTADYLDVALAMRDTSAGRRLPELKEMGLVEMTTMKALTRSGRRAHVWRAV